MIIGQVDHRDKGIDDFTPELLALQAAALELFQPIENLLTLQTDMAQLL